jgi:phosphatidylglycerophosphate synthase
VTTSDSIMATPRVDGTIVGLALQVGLLAGLDATTGLHALGWVTGAAFGLATWILLGDGLRRSGARVLGPANQVTLARTILVGGVAALAADSLTHEVWLPVVVALTAVALLLDGVDGQVARRTGSASALGARFDMEVDAFLILVLSVLLVRPVGPWVLAIGGLRYAFVAAGRVLPWLTAQLPPRFSRKVVAAAQGTVLVLAVAGVLPRALMLAAVHAALAALCWSFGRDVLWLRRSARRLRRSARHPGLVPANH